MIVMDMMTGAGGGAPPADLASILGGAQQPQAPQAQGDPVEIVSNMLDLASQYVQVEPDQEDKLAMQKVMTELQQLLAKDQQDADKAMGGNMDPRTLRKALSG